MLGVDETLVSHSGSDLSKHLLVQHTVLSGPVMECRMSRCLVFVLLSLSSAGSVSAQGTAPASVTIQVNELEAVLSAGSDRNAWTLRIAARVSVRNAGEQPLLISREQFRMLANGQPLVPGFPESSPALETSTISPGQTAEGWIWYSIPELNGNEPTLELQWSPTQLEGSPAERTENIKMDFSKEIRRLNAAEIKAIGPTGCLITIIMPRSLDALAAWTLRETLRTVAANDIQRILIVPSTETKAVVMDEFVAWLSTMAEVPAGDPVAASPLPGTGVRFQHVGIAGFTVASNRRFNNGRRAVQMHQMVDDAICSALTSVYRFVPVEDAIADLRSPTAGIRRAAMAGAVDRLSSEQASAILERARSGSEELQLEVASYLNLIPGKNAVDALQKMCLSGRPGVSAAALRSLASSYDNAANAAMAEIWKAAEESPSLRSDAIGAMIDSPDDRWIPLVADYVAGILKQATQTESLRTDAGQSGGERIAGALDFLRVRNHASTREHVLREILNIRNPALQDLLLDYLMHPDNQDSETVIRECVSQRLKAGSITTSIINAAIRYRDSSWTDALLQGFPENANADRSGPRSLQAVLACASPEQLERLADHADSLNAQHRTELLQYLAQINHPQWRDFAAVMISKPGERCSEVIQLLANDASEESLQILRERLGNYVASLEGTPDASVDGQHYLQTLMVHVSMFVHPECRRIMNRLARDPNAFVSERASRLNADAFRRSPAARAIIEETRLRRSGELEEANRQLDQCLELDPLLPDGFVRRASVRMHDGRFAESMQDLLTADRLSPEDVEVQSMIALVLVRLDDIEKGLQFAERVISDAPRDWTSLYNGACTFSRAIESPVPTAEMKQVYADRAIQLLRQTAELKFSDSEHMLQDADLNALHDHREWQAVVDLVAANKEVPPDKPGDPKPANQK